jgi:hypothetical protein
MMVPDWNLEYYIDLGREEVFFVGMAMSSGQVPHFVHLFFARGGKNVHRNTFSLLAQKKGDFSWKNEKMIWNKMFPFSA